MSDAFWSLSPKATKILLVFLMKRIRPQTPKGKKRKGYRQVIANNGEITFSYSEAEDYGISSDAFCGVIDELIDRVLLK